MRNVIKTAREEVLRLEKALKKIDAFLSNAPEGCLKWQNKRGKTYYYHQFMNADGMKNDNYTKWTRKYIKKGDFSLARALAQKHYYGMIRPILEKNLNELNRFLQKCPADELDEIYDNLGVERKNLVLPVQISVKEKVRQWQAEVYEKNMMYPENLRYETEQGDVVRSKSEVIIANILYQNQKDILYKYEKPLEVMENGRMKIIYPDFTILNIHTGKVTYWEHAGRMDDPHYADEFVRKINTYIVNDLLPGRDVVLTFESQNNALDISAVKRLVRQVISGF